MSDSEIRRIEKLEERVNKAEREITAVTEKQTLIRENLKEEIDRLHSDLRERIDEAKSVLKNDVDTITKNVESVNKQLQNIYVTQKGASTKISVNEKIIWAIVGLLGTGALYILQDLIKSAGAG